MSTARPARPEDYMSGGGTFSSCLDRAVRRPIPTSSSSSSNAAAAAAAATAGASSEPQQALADAISRSTSSDAANQDVNNNNSGYDNDADVAAFVSGAARAAAAEAAMDGNNDNANTIGNTIDNTIDNDHDDDNEFTQKYHDVQDWTPHHVSYPLLRSTLGFFSRRRAELRARLRDAVNVNHGSGEPPSSAGACGGDGNYSIAPALGEEDFNLAVNGCADRAPFSRRAEDGEEGSGDPMEYAGQRALGNTPPGGRRRRQKKAKARTRNGNGNNDAENNRRDDPLTVADVLVGAACSNTDGVPNACSPYLRMGSNSLLDESQITERLSHMERSELSAVLDMEVERSATFYRSRISELAPPRADGGTRPTFACGGLEFPLFDDCGGTEAEAEAIMRQQQQQQQQQQTGNLLGRISISGEADRDAFNYSDELIAPSQDRPQLSFTEMASEILELHAFVTTNIIVVRQVLIKYDAFARSLGGTPMGSWYQTTRRQRVKGRSSDFRDLVNHSKLKKLTRAYVDEYKRNSEEANNDGNGYGNGNGNGDNNGNSGDPVGDQLSVGSAKKKRRLKGLSKAYYRIVDSAEEMKKKQRLKWRQSAMHLDDEDGDFEAPGAAIGLDGRTGTPPPNSHLLSDSVLETPSPRKTAMSGRAPPSTGASSFRRGGRRLDAETPPPEPTPLHPPDYATLRSNPDIGEDIAYQVHIFKCIQSKTQRSIEKTYRGRASGVYDNFISTMREYFLLGSVSDNLSLMPEYLVMRGKSLKSSLLVVAQWREARNAHRYSLPGEQPTPAEVDQWFGGFCGEAHPTSAACGRAATKNSFALFLNILACFLYMMNYYIVEPSSTRYANALGMGDAMSGLIIGAMPWAAMISAMVYSFWSNHCYKAPLLTSGLFLTAGNVLYATAYRQESITMALCGRFLTGLGGPRSMNRRYIADTTPLAQRTAVNAAFGTATAMGAALGPATAIMLDGVDVQFHVPLYGMVYFNGMTGPGFVMGGLWILFTIILWLTFEEPERSGLHEQMRKELMESSRGESSMAGMAAAVEPSRRSEYELSNLDASKRPLWKEYAPGLGESTTFDGDVNLYQDHASQKQPRVLDSFGCPTKGGRDICPSVTDCTAGFNVDDEDDHKGKKDSLWQQAKFVSNQITLPVRICMFLLFSKMFTVESVISACSMVTKNRYGWSVNQVGTLGTIVGCLTIPISIFIGWVSQYREDRVLMIWLMSFAALGMGLLIDVSDFVSTETESYNEGHPLAVGPWRYIAGYLLVFCSVQAFDGVVGSVLSKVIPTALATGTLNSGLLATIIGTFGRACGDVFITSVGYIDLRQIMNLLFVPSFIILVLDLILICFNYDSLTA